jgi:hypothetical protein
MPLRVEDFLELQPQRQAMSLLAAGALSTLLGMEEDLDVAAKAGVQLRVAIAMMAIFSMEFIVDTGRLLTQIV